MQDIEPQFENRQSFVEDGDGMHMVNKTYAKDIDTDEWVFIGQTVRPDTREKADIITELEAENAEIAQKLADEEAERLKVIDDLKGERK